MKKLKFIGTINLGEEIYVSDPGYDVGIWCQAKLNNILPGQYNCYINIWSNEETKGWGQRVSALFILHKDYQINPEEKTYFDIGVDSGQAGFYDYQYFENTRNDDAWYYNICNSSRYGVIKNNKCVVSSSGYGDGGYRLYVGRNKDGKIVSAKIDFLGEW